MQRGAAGGRGSRICSCGRHPGADLDGLVDHSDRRVQYVAIRNTERLAVNGVVNSVGSRGDSYDNALAESINGLYKTELVRNTGPWRGLDLELAALEWIDCFNHRRLFHELGRIPPAEFETLHYRQHDSGHQAETHTDTPACNPVRFRARSDAQRWMDNGRHDRSCHQR